MVLLVFSSLVAVALWVQWWRLRWGVRRLVQLADVVPDTPAQWPRLTVVVSALNEEATVEPALRSLLALDYPGLEVVAVDDRSTDGTGAILDRLGREHPQLRVVHIEHLPDGWLGKNHALHQASALASGDYLLFTDADVHFAPQALRQAVTWCESQQLDHLAVLPELHVRQGLLGALLLDFHVLFLSVLPPWQLGRSSRVYVGMGAFNLVRALAYRAAGGHEALKLEVIDDVMLGRRLAQQGCRQGLLLGRGTVQLEWYRDAGALMRGLEKNALASADYSLLRSLGGTLLLVATRWWPFLALLLTSGWTWTANAVGAAAILLTQRDVARLTGWPSRWLAWAPLTPAVLLFILWRAVWLTLWRGAVVWRGTHYRLAQLRAARRAGDA